MPEIGDVLLNKYRIVKQLGEGGMGSVYQAQHEQIGKHVAVKVLHPELSNNPDLVARFTREAQAAGAIGHRSIIDVHDIGNSDDGAIFLVMEYLDGQNLAELLEETGPMDINATCYIMCQVLSALHAAHTKEIIHRDLKPDNIFLVQTGQALPEIKLLDFGISKMLMAGTPEDRLTRTGTIMGTPFYMAPEQARGLKELDHRVDLYAMGVIIYECLTGKVPFWADNTFALAYEILNSKLIPPRQVRRDIPEALEQVITTALARDPNERYQTALSMLQMLMGFLNEQALGRVSLPPDAYSQSDSLSSGSAQLPGSARGPSGISAVTPTPTPTPPLGTTPSGMPTPTAGGGGGNTPAGTPMAWQAGATSGIDAPPRKSRGGLAIGLLVVAILVVVGGFVAVGASVAGSWNFSSTAAPPPPTVPETPPTPETPPETPTLPASQPAEPPAESAPDAGTATAETVAITLEGVPEGARVLLDGEVVTGPVVTGAPSAEPRELRVEVDGREPWTERVVFDQDRTVAVSIAQPAPSSSPPSSTAAPAQPAPRERPSGSRPRPRRRRDVPGFDRSFH